MIQKGTYLNVIDNSGVKQICCIHVVGGYRKRYAKIGDIVIASVKSIKFKEDMKVKKGGVVKALVVRTCVMGGLAGNPFKHLKNDAVLLSAQNKFLGTRIFGGINKGFRYTKYSRIISLASGILE